MNDKGININIETDNVRKIEGTNHGKYSLIRNS